MKPKAIIRPGVKQTIKLFDFLTRFVPAKKLDALIIADFDQMELFEELNFKNKKIVKFSKLKMFYIAFLVRRSKTIFVDNLNIVVSSINDIEGEVIQIWHATSSIKKFGLPTLDNTYDIKERTKEYQSYDKFVVNSEYMAEKFKESFGISNDKIIRLGSTASIKLFDCKVIKPYFDYIVYVPTFRWNSKQNQKSIEFIKNFKSDKYKLIYSLHPKVEAEIENDDCIDVSGSDVRSYFSNAQLIISDYSSLLIDASLVCDKVAMYGYDIVDYEKDPGLNITEKSFWGFFTKDQKELIKYITEQQFIKHDKQKIKKTFFEYDDDNSVKRIAGLAKK